METSRLAALVLTLACAAPAATAGVGDVVDYKFRKEPVNALGITGFQDLRGKPVLVDFWGTR
jgi:hypothetical protein